MAKIKERQTNSMFSGEYSIIHVDAEPKKLQSEELQISVPSKNISIVIKSENDVMYVELYRMDQKNATPVASMYAWHSEFHKRKRRKG